MRQNRTDDKSSEHPALLLPWYVNGTLSEAERARVEAHLQACARCRQDVDTLRQLRQSLRAHYADQAPSEQLWWRIRQRIRTEQSGAEKPGKEVRERSRWLWLGGMAAAIFLAQVLMIRGQLNDPAVGGYQPLSGESHQAVASLQVRFAPRATMEQVSRLLQDLALEITGGPGALGLYQLRPTHSLSATGWQTLAERLRASGLVVEVILP